VSIPHLQVRLLGRLDWTEGVPGESTPTAPDPDAGGLIVSGFTPPARPHLRLSTSAAGVVGVLAGPGADDRTLVRLLPSGAELIQAPERVLGAVGRTDGVWVLTAGSLSVLQADATAGTTAELRADRILGTLSTPNALWALGADTASFVTAEGVLDRFSVPAWHRSGVAVFGDSIVGLDNDQRDQLVELGPQGSRHGRRPTFHTEPLERLLAYDGSVALLTVLTRLRRTGGTVEETLEIAGCGCRDEGAFVAVRAAGETWLITSHAEPQPLRLAPGEHVLAAARGRALVSSRTAARWIATGNSPQTFGEPIMLNAETYARAVEPHAWQMPPGFAIQASSPTDILLTASGQAGAAVLSVTWSFG
jgi:hypothetical protein